MMDESGCAFGAVVLAVLLGTLYGLYSLFTNYMGIFIGIAVVLGIIITTITVKKAKERKLKLEAKEADKAILQMEYADSPEGKIDQAIEKAKLKKHEQRELKSELGSLMKLNLDKVYVKHNLPNQKGEPLLEYKGRQSTKEEQKHFEETYSSMIASEINQQQVDFPNKEHFSIRNEVNNKYKELYFKQAYYYKGDYKPNLSEGAIQEVESVVMDLKGQQEVADTIIDYYDKVEKQLRQTRANYTVIKGLEKTKDSLERISASSLTAKDELQMAKEEAEYEALVFQELQKLSADFEVSLSSTMQGMVKDDLAKINEEFKNSMKS
ncbi:MAG: putative membrane protein [Flammeovirgaceae bacterium]|jgi:uncharacterized membrane protein